MEDGVSGLLVAPHDRADLAKGLRRLFDMDEASLVEMGRRAKERALTSYTRDRYFNEMLSLYERAGAVPGRHMISSSLEGLGDSVDTVIIGSGPAGLTLAMELARHGRPSVILESGVTSASAAQDLAAATIVDPSRHDDMSIAVARRLGGTSNLGAATVFRLMPSTSHRAPTRTSPDGRSTMPIWRPGTRSRVDTSIVALPIFDNLIGSHRGDGSFSYSKLERASNQPRFAMAHGHALRTSSLIDLRLDATLIDIQIGDKQPWESS